MHIPLLLATLLLFSAAASCNAADGSSHLVPILVVGNVVVLVVILFLLIIYYKKYAQLKRAAAAAKAQGVVVPPRRDREEHDSTIMERRSPGGGDGKLVFVDDGGSRPELELDDLLRASAEGLGKGSYKALTENGEAVVVKRLVDLKPLSSDEFVRGVRGIAAIRHPNLLPLLAYYHSKAEHRLFLYRFLPHGNLFNRLHGNLVDLIMSLFCKKMIPHFVLSKYKDTSIEYTR